MLMMTMLVVVGHNDGTGDNSGGHNNQPHW